MKQPIFKKVNGDGVKIQVAYWEGSGDTILSIHGISSNCRVWDVIADALTPEVEFYAIDLRGRGHSDKPETGYNIKKHCEDIKCVIDNLHIKPTVVMGHSLGAYIGVVFAALYSEYVKKLILVDGGGKLSEKQAEKVFEGIKPSLQRLGHEFNSFEDYINLMKKSPFLQPWMDFLENYYRYEVETKDNGKVVPLVAPKTIVEEAENLKSDDITNYYEDIKCPVLVLRATHGMLTDDDLLLPEDSVEIMKNTIKNIRIVNIENTNHYTIAFYPNKKRDKIIKNFLDLRISS